MPSTVPLGFIGNPLDRAHNRRGDAGWIEAQMRRGDALAVVLAGDRPVYRSGGNPHGSALMPAAEAEALAPRGAALLLGFDGEGRPVLAREAEPVDKDATIGAGLDHRDLRAFALEGLVPPDEVAIAGLARSLFAWHRSHRYCAACGRPSVPALGGYRRDCPDCGRQHFPRTDPVTIMLVTHGGRALVARSPRFVPGMYSAIAGFVEPGESIEEAVARETMEETGLAVGRVSYHMSQPWPFPSSLMIACFAEATHDRIAIDRQELEDARWASRGELAAALRGEADFTVPPPLAIAHHLVLGFLAREG